MQGWHDILRVLVNYRVRAVRVKQHDGGGARVRPERSRFGLGPRTERVERTLLFRWTKASSLRELLVTNQAGRRIRAGLGVITRSVSIILLCVLLRISGRHRVSLRNFDDDELSARVYIDKGPITRPLPQIEDLLPS